MDFVYKLFSLKIPPSERSTVPAISQTGANFGIIFTTPLVSVMIEQKFLGGWPSAFYVFGKIYDFKYNEYLFLGTMSCLWCIGWYFFGFNSPDQHPRISREERLFLQKHIAANTRKVSN
jgi:ACS family sodium-dependent inorganic phosphate cotransporter-like MFS transporter 5